MFHQTIHDVEDASDELSREDEWNGSVQNIATTLSPYLASHVQTIQALDSIEYDDDDDDDDGIMRRLFEWTLDQMNAATALGGTLRPSRQRRRRVGDGVGVVDTHATLLGFGTQGGPLHVSMPSWSSSADDLAISSGTPLRESILERMRRHSGGGEGGGGGGASTSSCPVCLDDETTVVLLSECITEDACPCSHVLCIECLLQLRGRARCPVCRHDLDVNRRIRG